VKLWDGKSVFLVRFEGFELRRRRVDVVEGALVHGEVHEVDAQLVLDLRLLFDRILNYDAHLLNCVHLSLLSHKDPVLELLVQVNCRSSAILQVLKSPVTDLDKSVPENGLLGLNGVLHLADVHALFNTLVFFLSGLSSLLGVFFALTLGVGLYLHVSHIRNHLLFQSHGEKLVETRVSVGI